MFLSNFSIKQPVTTVAIVIVLMCLGLLALKNLRVNQIPDVENPVMSINFPYPGASPETVEREIINRVEKPLQSIPQVYEIWSNASESNANFTIIFDFKKDMSEAGDEIRNAIASVRYKLPIEMREPVLWRRDPASDPIVNLGLSSTKQSHAEISRLAEDVLADQLRGIDGVSRGQRRRRAASRAVGAAARAEDARVQRLGRRGRERAARAEHQRARRPHQGRDGRAEHPARGPHRAPGRVQRHRREAPGQRDRAARPGGHGRRRLRGAGQLQPAQRPAQRRSVHHPFARGQHGHGRRARAQGSRGDQQDAARGHRSSRSRATAAKRPRRTSTT